MQRLLRGCLSTHTASYNKALVQTGSWQLLQELSQNLKSDCWKAVCCSVPQSWFFKALNQRQDHILLLLLCCLTARWDTPLPTPERPQEGPGPGCQPRVGQALGNNPGWTGWRTSNSCGRSARKAASFTSPSSSDVAVFPCSQGIPSAGSNCNSPVVSPLSSPGGNQCFIPVRKQAKDARGGTAKHGSVKIQSNLQICRYDQHIGSGRAS